MYKLFSPCLILFTVLTITACNQTNPTTVSEKKFLDPSGMDSTVRPGDNFYSFVNGKWLNKTVIPPTEFGVGGFTDLYNKTQDNLHILLDSLSRADHVAGSIAQKVGDFYVSGMDSMTIEKMGYEPLQPYLAKISRLRNTSDILHFVTELQKENKNILFSVSLGPDDKNSRMNIASFGQGGLGMPNRDYYFKNDSANLAVVSAYRHYIWRLFTLIGDDSVTATGKTMLVYNLEKQIAQSHKTNVELRDPQSNYHKVSVVQLEKKMPLFNWSSTLSAMDIRADSVNLAQPAFYIMINKLLKSISSDSWRAYLQFHMMDENARGLSNDFVMANFDFHNRALNGQQMMKPRWDRIVTAVDANLGEGLGEIYVTRYFSKDAKARMLELVNNLQLAFQMRISKLDWMSDSTKIKAREKLQAFTKKIGYPDTWRDYGKVSIDKKTYFANRISCQKNEFQRQAAKVGKPVDRTEWGMTPSTINAYYNPSLNEIVFPAGILQPPFFDPAADDAVNYGAIGMVIGHEMTHGFDDQGAQYDKDGNLKNWWSRGDSVKFVALTKTVNIQYNGFVAIDTFHVNGPLTTGENIADLGGLSIAYDAFKLTKQGSDTVRIDGFTPDERFFLSLATIWRSKYKDELMRQLVNVDNHSPDKYRVIGPLENFNSFYITFKIQKGDKMYKPEAERIKIW